MIHLVTQFSIRVQIPPSRCRSDSITPRLATGPQRSEAGLNGGPWQPQAGYPVSQASMGSVSLTFRLARLPLHFSSVQADAEPQAMGSLWTAVATTRFPRLKLLTDFLGVDLNRQHGMAFLERVPTRNGSAADRALGTRILRATLQRPDAPGHEPSSPAAPAPSAPTARRRHRRSA